MKLQEQAEKIHTRDDLVLFIQHLVQDLCTCPQDWENTSLEAYLGHAHPTLEEIMGLAQDELVVLCKP